MIKSYVLIIFAFLIWGFFPFFMYYLSEVSAQEVLWVRALSLLIAIAFSFVVTGRSHLLWEALTDRVAIKKTLISSILLMLNWFAFITAILKAEIFQISLGSLSIPIIGLLISRLILKEKLSLSQNLIALSLIITMIAYPIMNNAIPTYAIGISFTWAIYTFLQKQAPVEIMKKLVLEMLFLNIMFVALTPVFIFYGHPFHFTEHSTIEYLSLIVVGLVSSLALFFYNQSIRAIPLKMISVLQYISPIGQLITGIILYNDIPSKGNAIIYLIIFFLASSFTIIQIRQKS